MWRYSAALFLCPCWEGSVRAWSAPTSSPPPEHDAHNRPGSSSTPRRLLKRSTISISTTGSPSLTYLDAYESSGWLIDPASIKAVHASAKAEGTKARALVVINAGKRRAAHTTARCSYHTMTQLVRLCEKHSLVLANDVYQNNLGDGKRYPFTSFKKVVHDLGSPAPLVSIHRINEDGCVRRSGIRVDSMQHLQKEGEPWYTLWKSETDAIHAAPSSRTKVMAQP
ncbi:hypothetical protein B0H12DRAFT_1327182 [Mycena haematopus]|nr:hypothetical protein B0H12DRAFT_1327182 [Mycena haematopus]